MRSFPNSLFAQAVHGHEASGANPLRRTAFVLVVVSCLAASCGGGAGGNGDQRPPTLTSLDLLTGTSGGRGNLDGSGAEARFMALGELAVGPAGEMYATDGGSIRRISPLGEVTLFAGDYPGPRSSTWRGIAVAADGAVYYSSGRLYSKRPGHEAVEVPLAWSGVGDGDPRVVGPAIAFAANGDLWAAEVGGRGLLRIAPNGSVRRVAGPDARYETSLPFGPWLDGVRSIAVSPSGDVYMIAGLRGDILKFDLATRAIVTVAGAPSRGFLDGPASEAQFGEMADLAFDESGALFIADIGNNAIRRLAPDGAQVTTVVVSDAATCGKSLSAICEPRGVRVLPDRSLAVLDGRNSVLRKVFQSGGITTIAGLAPTYVDDAGRVRRPSDQTWGVAAAAPDGSAFVAADAAIYRVARDGAVTLLAGPPQLQFAPPVAFAVDGAGDLWVASSSGVLRINSLGEVRTVWTGVDCDSLSFDASGVLHCTSGFYPRRSIYRLRQGMEPHVVVTTDDMLAAADPAVKLELPRLDCRDTLAFLPGGDVFRSCGEGGWTASTSWETKRAHPLSGEETREPVGNEVALIAVGRQGQVYTAVSGGTSVRVLGPDGTFRAAVGVAGRYGAREGALPGSLPAVKGIAMNQLGELYISTVSGVFVVRP